MLSLRGMKSGVGRANLVSILEAAHKKCIRHREKIEASENCGCFYCQTIFASKKITEWCDDQWHTEGATALCPNCGIDSVIGDASGFDISPEFLAQMHERWFLQ